MKKKKRTQSPRNRRHPYERCLDHAMARLEKALAEQNECRAKLADLEKEVPYLEKIVEALTPPDKKPVVHEGGAAITRPRIRVPIPQHLKHFIEPVLPAHPTTEDEILKEPPGQALLD